MSKSQRYKPSANCPHPCNGTYNGTGESCKRRGRYQLYAATGNVWYCLVHLKGAYGKTAQPTVGVEKEQEPLVEDGLDSTAEDEDEKIWFAQAARYFPKAAPDCTEEK